MSSNPDIIKLAPFIYNRNSFYYRDHPEYHPDTERYLKYWEKEEKKAIEGFWGLDQENGRDEDNKLLPNTGEYDPSKPGGFRFMTPQHYWYTNYCFILHLPEENSSPITIMPDCRDIDWYWFYDFIIASGFCGFELDEEISCHYLLKRYYDALKPGSNREFELTPREKITWKKTKQFLKKPDGSYKEYKDPMEYLKGTFTKPLGRILYYNSMFNLADIEARGGGKQLNLNTKLRTPQGWVLLRDIKVGDTIFGSDGKEAKVTFKSIPEKAKYYKITLRDGRTIEACENHQWKIWNKNIKKKDKFVVLKTKDLVNSYFNERIDSKHKAKFGINKKTKEFKYAIPNNKAIELADKDLPIDPYILGCLIGDGCLLQNKVSITTQDIEIIDYFIAYCSKMNYTYHLYDEKSKAVTLFITDKNSKKVNNRFIDKLKKLNLHGKKSENKFIPFEYLNSSIEQRLSLLKGLMDTDGFCDKTHKEYYTSSKQLSDNFQDLVRSLGYGCKHSIKKTTHLDCHKISIYTNDRIVNLNRKYFHTPDQRIKDKSYITNIEEVEDQLGACISVDNYDNTYIIQDYIVTHNTYRAMGCLSQYFNFFGAKTFEEYLKVKKGPDICVGSANSSKSGSLLQKFLFSQNELVSNFGNYEDPENDIFIPGFFHKNTSGVISVGNEKNPYRHEYKESVGNIWRKRGTFTSIIHGSYADNSEVFVGKRSVLMIEDEFGLNSKARACAHCFIKGTEIRMSDLSLKKIEDIKVGDTVLGIDGREKTVEECHQGIDQLYKISQRGATDYIVNSKHTLCYKQNIGWGSDGYYEKSAEEVFNFSKTRKSKLYGLKTGEILFPKKDLKIDPYVMGYYLGDGLSYCGGFVFENSDDNKPQIEYIEKYLVEIQKQSIRKVYKKGNSDNIPNKYVYFYPSYKNKKENTNPYRALYRKYGSYKKKSIHNDFIFSSVDQRLQLLAGLIDSDGTYSNYKNRNLFTISIAGNEKLFDRIRFLILSLGFKCSTNFTKANKNKQKLYRLNISGDIGKIPTKCKTKLAISSPNFQDPNSQGFSIEKHSIGKFYGFSLKESPYFMLNDNTVVHNSDNTVMKMSGVKMGIALKTGTGGNVLKIIEAKDIFYNPDSYGYLRHEDLWENSPNGIGLFVPCYYVDSSFRDENGNQDVEAAYEQEMFNRAKLASGNSTKMLDGYIIDHPLVPSEMFLSPEVNIFPTTLLREHKANIEAKKVFENITSIGHLEFKNSAKSEVRWRNDAKDHHQLPITTFDTKKYDGNIEGKIVIYEHPSDNIPDPTFKRSLYKMSYDPYKDDHGGTSLAAIQVYKGMTLGDWNNGMSDTLVATYYGRYDRVEDVHEIAVMLAMYYNCKILPEIDLPGFVRYCKRLNKQNLLQICPFETFTNLGITQNNKYQFGVKISKSINLVGEQLIRNWLLEPIGYDEETDREILRLHKLYDLRLLDELINYTRDNNTDAVSAFQLIMFWIYQENLVPMQAKDKEYHTSKIDRYFDKYIKKKNKPTNTLNNQMFNW